MRQTAEEKVYYKLHELEKKLVDKTKTRPVYWKCSKDIYELHNDTEKIKNTQHNECDVFSCFIGAEGSQQNEVNKCKAAVNYPPKGLPIVINGPSGAGKSYLAQLVYKYAIQNKVIRSNAPFITLNCADYANNPELLSATLFGYKQGAFTGANNDRDGLLKEADGGYLFLDEIHRLSYENQEKLFIFMDKGEFRPLGENNKWISSEVRFIFATTENIEQVLLDTFRRRIPMKVALSSLDERPLFEKIYLIYMFYIKEAQQIKRDLYIDKSVVNYLCFSKFQGNIGMLKNLIKISCANAFNEQKGLKQLRITNKYISKTIISDKKSDFSITPLVIQYKNSEVNIEHIDESNYSNKLICSFFKYILFLFNKKVLVQNKGELLIKFKIIIKQIQKEKHDKFYNKDILLFYKDVFKKKCLEMSKLYGIKLNQNMIDAIFLIFIYFQKNDLNCSVDFNKIKKIIRKVYPRSCYISQKFIELLSPFINKNKTYIYIINVLMLQEVINEKISLHGLIIAHGESTASSIASVANSMCGTFIYEAIDMPIATSVSETVKRVNDYIAKIDTSEGLILLVDMGSLKKMYTSIKNNINGDLMIVNNLTTLMAIDIGFKMINNIMFKKIAEESQNSYLSEVQYYEGISPGNNIIVSCVSGMGISEKIKEIIENYVDEEKLKIITMDYISLKKALGNNDRAMLSNTKLIISTNNLVSNLDIPIVNISSNIWYPEGEEALWNALNIVISKDDFEKLKKDILNFFTIKGISSKLRFLNPKIIIKDVSEIVSGYETYYHINLDNNTKLNLYMHISLMIERLIVGHRNDIVIDEEYDEKKDDKKNDFMNISQDIFKEIINKYNVTLDEYEMTLLYELFKTIIK